MDQKTVYPESAARHGNNNLQGVREDIFPPGGCSILAGSLPGMQDEGSGPEDHQKMQRVWKDVYIFLGLSCREMAQILQGVFEESPVSKTVPMTQTSQYFLQGIRAIPACPAPDILL